MNYYDLIMKKRDGCRLQQAEIEHVVRGIGDGTMPDYQVAAWAMAVYFQGMDSDETTWLAQAMARSGDIVDLSAINGITVDKHSTGGVGDKTTLVAIPITAAAGVPVAKMSGRGLGHTGGTIDKFEAIPGFQVEMNPKQFIDQVNSLKAAIISQSGNLAPADKRLYAIRDLTATVESIPLIASSIMSKKLASGADAIVLDVKVGQGAFMKETSGAEALAQTMVDIGRAAGKRVVAVLTAMEQPLGNKVGNALEVQEAMDTLQGRGPQDLTEVSLFLAAQMLLLGQKAGSIDSALELATGILYSGQGAAKLREIIAAQGGRWDEAQPGYGLPRATLQTILPAAKSGFVQHIDAFTVGRAAMRLGAGRENLGDVIDHAVGIELLKKCGQQVKSGEPLAILHYNSPDRMAAAWELLQEAYVIGVDAVPATHLIINVIQGG
ncbi:MAG: thymidine phosphorylase [Syntrophomonadaceae bacterium]